MKLKHLFLALTTFALVSCATPAVTEPAAYCALTQFMVMKPETARFIAQNDPEFARGVKVHNATWLRECRK